jgi:hypothetical protein
MVISPRWVALCLMLLATSPAFAQQPDLAGRIKTASGAVFIVRGGAMLPAMAGHEVLASDGLKTGSDGSLGVTLLDDTRVSIGPGGEVRLVSYLYSPAGGRLALVLRFIQGAAVYVSGRIAKLAPDAVRLETPAAILGVRGTTLAVRVAPQ